MACHANALALALPCLHVFGPCIDLAMAGLRCLAFACLPPWPWVHLAFVALPSARVGLSLGLPCLGLARVCVFGPCIDLAMAGLRCLAFACLALGHGFTWLLSHCLPRLSHCLQLALALALACHALALGVFACSDLVWSRPRPWLHLAFVACLVLLVPAFAIVTHNGG